MIIEIIQAEVNNRCAQTGARTAPRDDVIDLLLETHPERESELEWHRERLPETLRAGPVGLVP